MMKPVLLLTALIWVTTNAYALPNCPHGPGDIPSDAPACGGVPDDDGPGGDPPPVEPGDGVFSGDPDPAPVAPPPPTNPIVDLPIDPPNPNLGQQNAEEALISVRDAMGFFSDDGATRAKGFASNAATGKDGKPAIDKIGLSKAGFGGDGKDKAITAVGKSAQAAVPKGGSFGESGTGSGSNGLSLASSGNDKKDLLTDTDGAAKGIGDGSGDSNMEDGGNGSGSGSGYGRGLAGGTGDVQTDGGGSGKRSGKNGDGLDDYLSKSGKLTLFEVVSRRYEKWGRDLDR